MRRENALKQTISLEYQRLMTQMRILEALWPTIPVASSDRNLEMTFGERKFPSSEMLMNVRRRSWVLRSQLSKMTKSLTRSSFDENIALWPDYPGAFEIMYEKNQEHI